jgi:TPR repeat protein
MVIFASNFLNLLINIVSYHRLHAICGLALTMLLVSTPILACGWWGDGEQSSENSSIVRLPDYPKLNSQQLADADHLASLGNQYRSTLNARHSYSRAVHFYELAAELDHTGAQYNLGLMYEMGLGVIVDRNRAAGWYRLAAEKGNVHAQHHLGELFISGNGVDRDLERGLNWLLLAARSGHADLFGRLASIYWERQPVEDYRLQTSLWATLAVENGDQSAGILLSDSRHTLTVAESSQLENLLIDLKQAWLVSNE